MRKNLTKPKETEYDDDGDGNSGHDVGDDGSSSEFGDDGSISEYDLWIFFCNLNYVSILGKLLVFVWNFFCNSSVLNE